MKTFYKTLVLATVVSFLSIPLLAQSSEAGEQQATKMVPATARLSRTLDADKDHPDSSIEANLKAKVTLSDGTVLPSNTTLIGIQRI